MSHPIVPVPSLSVRGLTKHFDVSGGFVSRMTGHQSVLKAVDGVSFELALNRSLGLVGESGSGKSTTARLIARLLPATAGEVFFEGQDVLKLPRRRMTQVRKEIQIIFQDPFSSLNPRMRVEEIVGRPLTIHFGLKGRERRERAGALLEQVGLAPEQLDRYPHEFSGGQRQRVAIARALASEPSVLLADEAVSSLDVSIQAQVLELLQGLRERLHLSLLFITHDLNVAEYISDDIAVMYAGRLVEVGPAAEVFKQPLHPYTQGLFQARPRFTRGAAQPPLAGEPAVPINPPPGCRFAHRCPIRVPACTESEVALEEKAPGRRVACIRV